MNLWVGLVSLFPEMVSAIASAGILGRAIRRGEMGFEVFNPPRPRQRPPPHGR